MKRNRILFFLFITAFSFVFGQQDGGYSKIDIYPVHIQLKDTKDNPIPNADVTIFTAQETVARGKTNAEGKASIQGLPTGDYDVLFQLENGYNVLFNNQWIETKEENERLYRLPPKSAKDKKSKNKKDDSE
ncbi:MAG: carboxypeptidase-like regulatory domain-containing protein [Bacteroidia bacterium]|nr:carboxypeptidase-like regulatory domain-containing protein [Bacteroidia bacterium]